MTEVIIGILRCDLRFFMKLWRNRPFHRAREGQLIEINLEAIRFKQFLVIWKIIVTLVIGLLIKALYKKTPPAVPVSEINRSIHCFHFAFLKPLLTLVKK